MTTPYPLAWPETLPRAKRREAGRFKTTVSAAMKNVADSIRLFGSDSGKPVVGLVISSNVTLALVRATFQGFKALPPSGKRSWRDVMAPADALRTKDEIEARYRTLAKMRHPDHGGSDAMMAELNQARADALKEVGE